MHCPCLRGRRVRGREKGALGGRTEGQAYGLVPDRQNVYDQQTYREGGQVRTLNRYIGRADDVSLISGASHSGHANAPAGLPVTTTPDKYRLNSSETYPL